MIYRLGADFWNTVSWRWPRSLTAVLAGFSLGIAGVLTQRLTGNPLASPGVLGISSGAGIGALIAILAIAQPDRTTQMAFATTGAIATLALIFAFAWIAGSISRVSPQDAIIAFSFSILAAAILPAMRRWLAIMPLGNSSARAVGVNDNVSNAVSSWSSRF